MDKRSQIIEVIPYDANWRKLFAIEDAFIKPIFGENYIKLHHIGSTAVPGLAAKPTLDMLLEVNSIQLVDQLNTAMAELGYDAWGAYGIEGRRFFVKGEEKRTHHLHVFQYDSAEIQRHFYLRDYLIAHPQQAQAYGRLKIDLAKKFARNRRQYFLSKQSYVKTLEAKAIKWFKNKKLND